MGKKNKAKIKMNHMKEYKYGDDRLRDYIGMSTGKLITVTAIITFLASTVLYLSLALGVVVLST
ncbi:hypothetical protein AB832_06595 [Flavobacteriaceae bacterium (ex Bugula neritina AB1)]|nr:hypothetical protein AB832_06595 [Flavobacteriaceae bacterium (ex Bugula neritina AB1)]